MHWFVQYQLQNANVMDKKTIQTLQSAVARMRICEDMHALEISLMISLAARDRQIQSADFRRFSVLSAQTHSMVS